MKNDAQTVIVTGGGRGTGAEIARAYLERGANVFICGRNEPEKLPQTEAGTAIFVKADIRDPDQVSSLMQAAVDRTGRLDVLVNNAGGGPPLEAASAPSRLSEAIIRLNLIGPLHCAQAAYGSICQTVGSGNIISIASVSGTRPSAGTAAYGAAKAGLINLTQSLAMEWAPKVRVNAIIAGLIQTEAADDHYGGAEGIQRISAALPMHRMATPRDIANACLFLSSDEASYVSGAALEVHGAGEPLLFPHLAKQI